MTIAILGHGIDVTFPASTAGIRQRIMMQGGAVVSEHLPHDTYHKERFVQRNRLQAALSRVVGIVEGRSRSGTAHTVGFARRLQCPLFGVRFNPSTETPQQELVNDIERMGSPVFDIGFSGGKDQLRA